MQREHLDPWNIDYALLTGPPPFYGYTGLPDPDWAAALCRAFNDWTIEHWLEKDERVVNAILISPSDPAQAVSEINRLADRRDTAAVMVPMGTSMPFGNRFYHPILGGVRGARSAGCRSYRRRRRGRPDYPHSGRLSYLLHGIPHEPSFRGQYARLFSNL